MELHTLIDYFIHPSQRDSAKSLSRARNVVYAALLSIFTSLFFIGMYHYLQYSLGIYLVSAEIFAMGIILFFSRTSPYTFLCREAICLILALLFFGLSCYQGGLYAPSIVWLAIVPPIAAFMGGVRSCIAWVSIIALLLATCLMAQLSGFTFPMDMPTHVLLLEGASTFGMLFVLFALTLFFETNKQRGFHELGIALKKIESLATHDHLTGVYNRHQIFLFLQNEKKRSERTARLFSICMMDIDLFKKVNDTYGHAAGDTVLQSFSDLVEATIRSTDYFGRYGGEEFLLLLPETPINGAYDLAQRLRQKVEFLRFPTIGPDVQITISIGVTQFRYGEEIATLVERADLGLYEAKKNGRNIVQLM